MDGDVSRLRLLRCTGSRPRHGCRRQAAFFADACRLAREPAQEIQLGPAYPAFPHQPDLGDRRRVQREDPLDFDVVAKAAANAKCLLEINGSERLDLPDTLAAAAKGHGVRFVLSTDAHNQRELGFMRFAVAVARRAGLTAADILNTRPTAEFVKGLRRSRNR